jgi:hypothetical protein
MYEEFVDEILTSEILQQNNFKKMQIINTTNENLLWIINERKLYFLPNKIYYIPYKKIKLCSNEEQFEPERYFCKSCRVFKELEFDFYYNNKYIKNRITDIKKPVVVKDGYIFIMDEFTINEEDFYNCKLFS